jgi:hypothetical protein
VLWARPRRAMGARRRWISLTRRPAKRPGGGFIPPVWSGKTMYIDPGDSPDGKKRPRQVRAGLV